MFANLSGQGNAAEDAKPHNVRLRRFAVANNCVAYIMKLVEKQGFLYDAVLGLELNDTETLRFKVLLYDVANGRIHQDSSFIRVG